MIPTRILKSMILVALSAAGSLAEVSAAVRTSQSQSTGNSNQPSPQEVDGDLIRIGSLLQRVRAVEDDKKANAAKRATLDKDKAALVQECKQFDEDRNRVAARWPQGKLLPIEEATEGNIQIDRINKWHGRLTVKAQALKARFDANDQEAVKLKQTSDLLNSDLKKVTQLLSHLPAFAECLAQPTLEGAHQCMQSKWDGARSSYSMDPMVVKPAWRATPLTAEEAIERFKQSGNANPGPKTVRTNPVPPPAKKSD